MKKACNSIGGVIDGATDTAKTVAKGATDLGNTVAKGTTDTAKTVAKGTTDTAKTVAKGVGDAVDTVGDFFGRKKRSITLSRQKRGIADPVCGAIKNIDTKLDLKSLIGLNLSLKDLKPDIADMSQLKTKFSNAMDQFLSVTQTIIDTLKKIFYFLTLVYMMYDGYRYVFSPNIY